MCVTLCMAPCSDSRLPQSGLGAFGVWQGRAEIESGGWTLRQVVGRSDNWVVLPCTHGLCARCFTKLVAAQVGAQHHRGVR